MREEKIQDFWDKSYLEIIYGNAQEYVNYRNIKLMNHTEQIWKKVVKEETEVSEYQFGFMPRKSTMKPLFCVRELLIDKYIENRRNLKMVFIDLLEEKGRYN